MSLWETGGGTSSIPTSIIRSSSSESFCNGAEVEEIGGGLWKDSTEDASGMGTSSSGVSILSIKLSMCDELTAGLGNSSKDTTGEDCTVLGIAGNSTLSVEGTTAGDRFAEKTCMWSCLLLLEEPECATLTEGLSLGTLCGHTKILWDSSQLHCLVTFTWQTSF